MAWDLSMLSVGSGLNAAVSLSVVLSGAVFLSQLHRLRNTPEEFIYVAYRFWLLSWIVWLCLWLVEVAVNPTRSINSIGPDKISFIKTLLSDLNTLFLILFYRQMTRGQDAKANTGKRALASASILVGVIGILYLIGLLAKPAVETGFMLHLKWSVALSMFSPVLVGWSFRLRHNSNFVFVIGLLYASLQPVAYVLMFENSDPVRFSLPTGESLLLVLAFFKIAWALSVTYFIGRRPLTTDSLIVRVDDNENYLFEPGHIVSPQALWRTIFSKRDSAPFKSIHSQLRETNAVNLLNKAHLQDFEAEVFLPCAVEVFNNLLNNATLLEEEGFIDLENSSLIASVMQHRNPIRQRRSALEYLFRTHVKSASWLVDRWTTILYVLIFALALMVFTIIALGIFHVIATNINETLLIVGALAVPLAVIASLAQLASALVPITRRIKNRSM